MNYEKGNKKTAHADSARDNKGRRGDTQKRT
jgi:hypothetical protein